MKKMNKFVSLTVVFALLISVVCVNKTLAVEYPTLTGFEENFENCIVGEPYTNEMGGSILFGGGASENNYLIADDLSYRGNNSLCFYGRENNHSRIKFDGFWGLDGLLDFKRCTVSFYVYPVINQYAESSSIRVGFYDNDAYKTKPSYSEEFTVKNGEWNYIEFSFEEDEDTIIVGDVLGIDQPNGTALINGMYIDNYSYKVYDKYSLGSSNDFDNGKSIKYTPGGNFKGTVALNDDIYYGPVGRSLKISGREYKYNRVKFNNVFSIYNDISRNDLGNAYRVSCVVYFDDLYECDALSGFITDEKSDEAKTKLNFGVFTTSTEDNISGELYVKEFEVYKNTWTQLDFIYILDDRDLENENLMVAVDQIHKQSDNYPSMKDLYIDNLEVELLQDYVSLSLTNNGDNFYAYCATQYSVLDNSDEKCILICEYDENDIMINSEVSEQEYAYRCSLTYTPISSSSKIIAYALNNMYDMRPYTFPVEYDQSAIVEE